MLKRVRAFQIELEFESVDFKGEGRKGEKQQQTQPTYDARRRQDWNPRAALLGGECKIRLLKERHEGVKNTCNSSHIHYISYGYFHWSINYSTNV